VPDLDRSFGHVWIGLPLHAELIGACDRKTGRASPIVNQPINRVFGAVDVFGYNADSHQSVPCQGNAPTSDLFRLGNDRG
jgi:hypothetical protein